MHLNRAVLTGLSATMLLAAPGAMAQTQADRRMYEPMFDNTLDVLNRQSERVAESNAKLAQATDLVEGCGLLDENVTHLKEQDKLLTELGGYAEKLRDRSRIEAVKTRHSAVRETLELREGDIERMCQDLPES